MKKMRIKKIVIVIVVVVLLLAAYLFYSRPMNLLQLYPLLTLEKCTKIHGFYSVGMQEESSEFVIEKNDEEFQKLLNLFYEQKYSRTLRDILPKGTRSHRAEENDFQWDVYICFERVEYPDGSGHSGDLLHFQNWYGELDIYFDTEQHSCRTSNQETWAKEILNIIQ